MEKLTFKQSVFTFYWGNYQFDIAQYHRAVWLKCWGRSPKKLIVDTPFKTFGEKILTYKRAEMIAEECVKKLQTVI